MKKIMFQLMCLLFITNPSWSQKNQLTGLVSEKDGNPITGATVMILSTVTGTITDLNGKFIISADKRDTLQISFLGYMTQKMPVGGNTTFNIVLLEDTKDIDEVIVVGYTTQKKSSITSAVSNVGTDELKLGSAVNLSNSIAGKISGTMIRMMDGNIGGGQNRYNTDGSAEDAKIFIRGVATTGNASPLVLIDNIEGSLSQVHPEDVDQITVLKDAAAKAVYGVRAANGVILVTTKRGTKGAPVISYNGQYRFYRPLIIPRPLNSYQYAVLYNEALYNDGAPALYTNEQIEHWRVGDDPIRYPYVDWRDELVADFFTGQQHDINVRGGGDLLKYYMSASWINAGGPFKTPSGKTSYDRYNFRSNFDFNITKTTIIELNLNTMIDTKREVANGEPTGGRYGSSFWLDLARKPNRAPIYNPNGTFSYGGSPGWNSKVNLLNGANFDRRENEFQVGTKLNQKLSFWLDGLSASVQYSLNIASGGFRNAGIASGSAAAVDQWEYNPDTDTYKLMRPKGNINYTTGTMPYDRKYSYIMSLNYDKVFAGEHEVNALVNYNAYSAENEGSIPSNYLGYAGRFAYNYSKKYFIEGNVAYSGSDAFPKDQRYAWFPAISAAWILSHEQFFAENFKAVSFLRFRGSYGKTGNDRGLPTSTDEVWGNGADYYFGVPKYSITGMQQNQLSNHVTWEVGKSYNIGADIKFFRDKLNLTAEIFKERRTGVFLQPQGVPDIFGLTGTIPSTNIGIVSNQGYEIEVSYNDKFGDFGFGFNANYSFARSNRDYIGEAPTQYDWLRATGTRVGQNFGYVWTGKFLEPKDVNNPDVPKIPTSKSPGDLLFEDLDKDGQITPNDRKAIGYSQIPEKMLGLNLNFSYRRFNLSALLQGAGNFSTALSRTSGAGNWLFLDFYANDPGSGTVFKHHLDRWAYVKDNAGNVTVDTRATAKYPALHTGGNKTLQEPYTSNTFVIRDADYLRLKALEIGYDFPLNRIRHFGLSNLRLYLAGANLFTIDNLDGLTDPEQSGDITAGGNSNGQRGAQFPNNKYYSIGVSLKF